MKKILFVFIIIIVLWIIDTNIISNWTDSLVWLSLVLKNGILGGLISNKLFDN